MADCVSHWAVVQSLALPDSRGLKLPIWAQSVGKDEGIKVCRHKSVITGNSNNPLARQITYPLILYAH